MPKERRTTFPTRVRLPGGIEGKDRLVIRNPKGGRIRNGVVHVQSTGSHFLPENPGGELFKAPVCGRTMGQKSHGAGESAEEADTQKQLVEGKGRTFSHDSYLMTESVGKSICEQHRG